MKVKVYCRRSTILIPMFSPLDQYNQYYDGQELLSLDLEDIEAYKKAYNDFLDAMFHFKNAIEGARFEKEVS